MGFILDDIEDFLVELRRIEDKFFDGISRRVHGR